MIKRICILTAIFLCVAVSAQAVGFVTPLYPHNQEKHDQFWAYMDEVMGPWLQKNPQEKWSAQRCREVAEKFEKDGFVLSNEYKDRLYRTKREHRLYATEAYSLLCESQIGEQWQWSLYDRWRMRLARQYSGIMSNNNVMPGPSDLLLDEMLAMAQQKLNEDYQLTDEQLQAYDYGVHLNGGLNRVIWMVNVYADLAREPYRNDFCVEYIWPDGQLEVTDWRPRHPKEGK